MDRPSIIEVVLVTMWGIFILLAVLRQLKMRLSSATTAVAEVHFVNQEMGVATHNDIIECLVVSVRQFCLPTVSISDNLWLLLRLAAWAAQAVGIRLLIQYCLEFNGEMMDNAAPYYEIYDDPYSDANYVLPRKVSSSPILGTQP